MAIPNRAEHGVDRQAEEDGRTAEKSSVEKVIYFKSNTFGLLGHLVIAFFFVSIWSCSWSGYHQAEYTITERGIENLITINMTIDEFERKGIPYTKVNSPYQKPNAVVYNAYQIGIQFETINKTIIRIWFFAEQNRSFKLLMPKKVTASTLSSISANDIIQNFGKVTKYENRYPPKGKREAVWAKYHSFGIPINTIDYPDMPLHFGLNWDDTLSYVTISKID
jgi:hypothetical protein